MLNIIDGCVRRETGKPARSSRDIEVFVRGSSQARMIDTNPDLEVIVTSMHGRFVRIVSGWSQFRCAETTHLVWSRALSPEKCDFSIGG